MSAERVLQSLVGRKMLDARRASDARDTAAREGVPLGRWLMEAGWVTPDAWAAESARALDLAFAESPARDPELTARWPAAFFARHRARPLRVEDGRLLVAVLDPTDVENLEAIESFVRMPVHPVCAPERVVRASEAGAARDAGRTAALALDEPQPEAHLRLLHEILRGALRRGATDVHLVQTGSAGLEARLRVDGLLGGATWATDAETAGPLVNRIRVLAGVDVTESRIPQDGSFAVTHDGARIDVRASFLPTRDGTSIVLRLLDRDRFTRAGTALTLESLGIQPIEREAILGALRRPHGMVLVVGPTGSGKSTTLHAALAEAEDPTRKLVTIEDPVEYRLRDAVQVEVNERAGLDFASGLRSILRHDPDRILVGEIRDGETAAIALQAALTGHLVLTSLHATSTADVTERVRALGMDPESFARASTLLVAQRLVRRTCAACTGTGCSTCEGAGFRGRLALAEVSRPTTDGGGLRPCRPIREVAAAVLEAGFTTRSEIERVWPEAFS